MVIIIVIDPSGTYLSLLSVGTNPILLTVDIPSEIRPNIVCFPVVTKIGISITLWLLNFC